MPFSCGFVLLLTPKSAAVHNHFSSVWLEIRVNFLSDNRWIVGSYYLFTFGRDFARNTIALTLLACLLGCYPLCLTLYNPMDCGHQAPLSMALSRHECWTELLCSPAGDLSNPGIEPGVSYLLHWRAGSLPLAPPGKPLKGISDDLNISGILGI